ncbi:hypothetical protein BDR04DRAFT_1163558 [Suillus decipiens]|nr:hypothetical protein BDR04DRAFT_1163558 [Suillus decipiens]
MSDLLTLFALSATSASSPSSKLPDINLEQASLPLLGSGTPFYQFYTDFLALYDAISFSHPIFASLLLPPLALTYPIDYHRILWADFVLMTGDSQNYQAQALKALESKVDSHFQTLIEKMGKQEKNIQTLIMKSDSQERNIQTLVRKSDSQEAELSYHHLLIEEQGKDMRKGFDDLERCVKELDTSILAKLGQ